MYLIRIVYSQKLCCSIQGQDRIVCKTDIQLVLPSQCSILRGGAGDENGSNEDPVDKCPYVNPASFVEEVRRDRGNDDVDRYKLITAEAMIGPRQG